MDIKNKFILPCFLIRWMQHPHAHMWTSVLSNSNPLMSYITVLKTSALVIIYCMWNFTWEVLGDLRAGYFQKLSVSGINHFWKGYQDSYQLLSNYDFKRRFFCQDFFLNTNLAIILSYTPRKYFGFTQINLVDAKQTHKKHPCNFAKILYVKKAKWNFTRTTH